MATTTTNRLAELRESQGWSRTKVAADLDVGERVVYRWEVGETPVPSDCLPTLAALFEVSIEHLMGWDRETADAGSAAA